MQTDRKINVHRIEFQAEELSQDEYIALQKKWCGIWHNVTEDEDDIALMISDVAGYLVNIVHYFDCDDNGENIE